VVDIVHHGVVGAAGVLAANALGYPDFGVAFLLASLAPDLDVLFVTLGKARFLRLHQGATHSLLGQAAISIFGAALMSFSTGGDFPEMLGGFAAGAALHVVLDLLNTFGVMLLWPFCKRRFCADAFFFIDVWVLAASLGTLAGLLVGCPPLASIVAWVAFVVVYAALKIICRLAIRHRLGTDTEIPSGVHPLRWFVTYRGVDDTFVKGPCIWAATVSLPSFEQHRRAWYRAPSQELLDELRTGELYRDLEASLRRFTPVKIKRVGRSSSRRGASRFRISEIDTVRRRARSTAERLCMRLRVFRAQKAPGFRLSVSDVLIGVAAVIASSAMFEIPGVEMLWPLPVHVFTTFFCFCNVFRIGTRQEVFWMATVACAFGIAVLAEIRPYPFMIAATVPTAVIAVFRSARGGRYNGVCHRAVRAFFEPSTPPTFDLARFVRAQADGVYEQALTQVAAGRKVGHWIWFVAPNAEGLGASFYARTYAIGSMEEARAYLAHPVLGPRLVGFAQTLLSVEGKSAREIFRDPDDLKVRSCMTLFAYAGGGKAFGEVIDKFYAGTEDRLTLDVLKAWSRRRRGGWWRRSAA
jgi:uncharacterized protein (DUF1810 family)/membrane-bound metal-dependent hydrolase YbcI (DUF457 family)